MVGYDGTGPLTGVNNGAVRQLEEKSDRPLQWAIYMLHCNELHLGHVFTTIDGTATSPSSFPGPIGRSLFSCVKEWEIAPFEKISNCDFPHLPNDVLTQLSCDQFYAYQICQCVITGEMDDDIALLEVGILNQSRWLILACRIFRKYTSAHDPSTKLTKLTEYCIKVYFPSWFEIKTQTSILDGALNFYDIIQRL